VKGTDSFYEGKITIPLIFRSLLVGGHSNYSIHKHTHTHTTTAANIQLQIKVFNPRVGFYVGKYVVEFVALEFSSLTEN